MSRTKSLSRSAALAVAFCLCVPSLCAVDIRSSGAGRKTGLGVSAMGGGFEAGGAPQLQTILPAPGLSGTAFSIGALLVQPGPDARPIAVPLG